MKDQVANLRKKVKDGRECSLEMEERREGGVYLWCRDVNCDGDCRLYVVSDEDGCIREIGCDCK